MPKTDINKCKHMPAFHECPELKQLRDENADLRGSHELMVMKHKLWQQDEIHEIKAENARLLADEDLYLNTIAKLKAELEELNLEYEAYQELAIAEAEYSQNERAVDHRVECTDAECGWTGLRSECYSLGEIGPLCPECKETTESAKHHMVP